MPNLETHLDLNRYCHALLGATEFASLKNLLRPLPSAVHIFASREAAKQRS